jgi:hypothetical protein
MLYDFYANTPMKEGNACDDSGKSGFFKIRKKKENQTVKGQTLLVKWPGLSGENVLCPAALMHEGCRDQTTAPMVC